MATVLRVRRKRSCDPVEALVLSCKRAKSADTTGTSLAASAATVDKDVQKVFKLVGTVAKKDQPIATRIQTAISKLQPTKKNSSKSTIKSKSKSKSSKTVKDKSRSLHEASVQSGRFKVTASQRGLKLQELDTTTANGTISNPDVTGKLQHRNRPTSLVTRKSSKQRKEEAEARQLFSLFDLEHEDLDHEDLDQEKSSRSTQQTKTKTTDPDVILCNNVQMIREKLVLDDYTIPDSEYVYDLYYIDDGQVDFEVSDGATVGMHYGNGDGELVYEFYPSDQTTMMYAEEEDDSNDEDNWRNDYPDEDPDKRHPDLFDELLDDYNYGEISSDDDLNYGEDHTDYRHRGINKLDLEYCDKVKEGSGSDLDEYAF